MNRSLVAVLLLVVWLWPLGCTQTVEEVVQPPDQILLPTPGPDEVVRIPPGEWLGNVEITLMPGSIQGDAILLMNGPARAVGFDLTDADNRSVYYFGDGYTGSGDTKLETGTTIPQNQWLYIRVVVYRTLSGGIVVFLDLLGADFFEDLEQTWVEAVFEVEVYIGSGEAQATGWRDVTSEYANQFQVNTERHQQEGYVVDGQSYSLAELDTLFVQ